LNSWNFQLVGLPQRHFTLGLNPPSAAQNAMSTETASAAFEAPPSLRRLRCPSAPLLVTRLRIGDATSRRNLMSPAPVPASSARSDDCDVDATTAASPTASAASDTSSSSSGGSALVRLISWLLSTLLLVAVLFVDTLIACAIACGFDFCLAAPFPLPRLIRGAARLISCSLYYAVGISDDGSAARLGNHTDHSSNDSGYRRRSRGGRMPHGSTEYCLRSHECTASLPPLSLFSRGVNSGTGHYSRASLAGRVSSSLCAHAWRAALCAYALWNCVGLGTESRGNHR
jgi:hypothetical protein